ncbi:MAG: GmrSD restriction endonuclease domain-containing protein [Moraxellaceae bacterium]
MADSSICFKRVDYALEDLLTYIDIGDIGLPDIQRPFVWKNTKIRDLFDSMYRGFPVGYFLFWANHSDDKARGIGTGSKVHEVPNRLIVDGQQRLTSLFAVFRGQTVLDENYQRRPIEIAFQPRTGKFEVADNSIRRDPEWIANISMLWAEGQSTRRLVNAFIEKLSERGPLSEAEEEQVAESIERLINLKSYPFTALEIAESVDEEQVAEIFVRINSEGKKLNQADFILTLLSVFWHEGRLALEQFCAAARVPAQGKSPFNHFIEPDPDQLLRVSVALAFRRARLKSVYQVLRGKDAESGEYSATVRDEQFAKLKSAQADVLNLTHWHQYLSALVGAGFRSRQMISSELALMYGYVFYLIGRVELKMPEAQLQRLIGRWFFFITLKGRYSSSPESKLDADLADLRGVSTPAAFAELLESRMAGELTGDFWEITLPFSMESSSARSPEFFAFVAAQNLMNAPVLFSHKKVSDLLDPAVVSTKEALERHHLFPKAWLKRNGIEEQRQTNQLANYALIEWSENIRISDDAPASYLPPISELFATETWKRMQRLHAMPDGWEHMEYFDFLKARRQQIADLIRQGFLQLSQ